MTSTSQTLTLFCDRVNLVSRPIFLFFAVMIIVLSAASCAPVEEPLPDDQEETNVVLLHIALQEGFSGDTVLVLVNGDEVFRQEEVTTRLQLGVADSFDLDDEAGTVSMEILVSSRDLTGAAEVQTEGATYVGVSILDDRVDIKVQYEPFRYL